MLNMQNLIDRLDIDRFIIYTMRTRNLRERFEITHELKFSFKLK